MQKGVVVYVGKTKNPFSRIYHHMMNQNREMVDGRAFGIGGRRGPTYNGRGIKFDGIRFYPCMLGQLDMIEGVLIRKFLPRYNTRGMPPQAIPEDIRAILKQMITITGLPPIEDRPKVYIRRLL